MSVMLHVGDFKSGLSVYRAKQRPFPDQARDRLQRLTQAMTNAVQSSWLYAESVRGSKLRECLLDEETGVIRFTQLPLRQIDRTPAATRLLDAWFPGNYCGTGGIPPFFLEELAKAQAAWLRGEVGPWDRRVEGETVDLKVRFRPSLDGIGEPAWKVTLREVPHVPFALRRLLSGRSLEVCTLVLRGLSDKEIAARLKNAPPTVKKQTRSMYRALKDLKVGDRAQLLAYALREM